MESIRTLIHIHTNYSFDSNLSPEALSRFASRAGIGCVAVTDHDTIDGALHLSDIAEFKVVIGEEVSTRDGDVIGLFLKHRVSPGMSARETALAIKEQGGLVLVPHPFIKVFGCGLRDAIWNIADLIDAVEVCNGQNILSSPDRKAGRFAKRLDLTAYVGSDSHTERSIAPCFQMMRAFNGPGDFLQALAEAKLVHGRHTLPYFAAAAYRSLLNLAGFPFPAGFGINHESVSQGQPVPVRA